MQSCDSGNGDLIPISFFDFVRYTHHVGDGPPVMFLECVCFRIGVVVGPFETQVVYVILTRRGGSAAKAGGS